MEDKSSFVPSFCQGLSILLVDNDKTSLMYLSSMLEQYAYKVTTNELATSALSMVEEQKGRFKLVIANVNMPDMDTLQFLHLLLDKDIPVILVSSESNINAARKAIGEGASFYLSGPICVDDLKYIWQHAYRTKRIRANSEKKCQLEGKYRGDFGLMKMDNIHLIENSILRLMTVNNNSNNIIQKQNGSKTKRPNEEEDEQGQMMMRKDKKVKITYPQQVNVNSTSKNGHGNSNSKKSRIVWTPELHLRFTAAISQLGDKKARPKPILEIMNVPHLTARQVASHLQKYSSQVQRICETGITPAVSRSSNFYGWTRNFQTLHHNTSQHNYQPTPPSNFGTCGNLLEIIKASSDNYTPPVPTTSETSKKNNQVSVVSSLSNNIDMNENVSNPSCGLVLQEEEENHVMEISNTYNASGGDADDCFDEWMNEILNPIDPVEMEKIMKTSTTSCSYDQEQVMLNNILEVHHEDDHDRITAQPNQNDVDRYCNWLTDALL